MPVWSQAIRVYFATALLWMGLFFGPAFAQTSEKIVSTSLCADAYVLALAPAPKIKTLSWQANTELSVAPAPLRQFDFGRANSEILVSLSPAMIVLGPGDNMRSAQLAKVRNSQVFQLGWKRDFSGAAENIQALGSFLGRTDQANFWILTQNKRLQKLAQRADLREQQPSVLYLTPTLGTAGSGTLVDAAILAAGGKNYATEIGISGWGQLPLELLARLQPDLLITSFFTDGPSSAMNFRSNHTLIKALREQTPELQIPGANWICAGPKLILVAEQIADKIDTLGTITTR